MSAALTAAEIIKHKILSNNIYILFTIVLITKLSVYVCQPVNISKYKQKHLVRGKDGGTEGHNPLFKV